MTIMSPEKGDVIERWFWQGRDVTGSADEILKDDEYFWYFQLRYDRAKLLYRCGRGFGS